MTSVSRYVFIRALVICLLIVPLGLAACGELNAGLSIAESNNRVAQATVHVAAVGLGELLENVDDEADRIETIRNFIDPIRFFQDESGYFYVYYYNCVNVAHAIDKSLLDQDLTDYQDMRGTYVIQELSAAAQNGGGFVTFYWPHPQSGEEQEKIGYVEPVPGTDYFIGTGYYPDTE